MDFLKHLFCPKGDQCTTKDCLFRHNHEAGADADAPPRKRVKTDTDEEYDPASPSFAAKDEENEAIRKEDSPKPKAQDVPRPISPPPLKRKLGSSPVGTPPTQRPKGPIPKHLPAAKKKVRAPEDLNPRHISAAPAPHEIRHKLLVLLHGELTRLNGLLAKGAQGDHASDKRLLLTKQELIWRALDEEEKFATTKGGIYSNVLKNHIVAYKKMPLEQYRKQRTDEKAKADKKALPVSEHPENSIRGGAAPSPQQSRVTGPPTDLTIDVPVATQINLLRTRLLTPISDLAAHGYVPTVPTNEDIDAARRGVEAAKGWEECDRCRARFQVFPGRREEDGLLASGGKCTHHPGRRYWPQTGEMGARGLGTNTARYKCCHQAVGDSTGCETAEAHVFKVSDPKRLASIWNFEQTPENDNVSEDTAVCFDCEMGYTSMGMEVIRVTATSWPFGETLLDVLVRPIGEILDLNSRYSGVWPADMVDAQPYGTSAKDYIPNAAGASTSPNDRSRLRIVPSPQAARALLFSLIAPTTPLIGHGLENDLNTLRIVHPTLIDTILLYPHNKGLPIRHGLRALTEMHLNRRIQIEEEQGGGEDKKGKKLKGHDSAEDAIAAGDLVRLRLKKEYESMKRTELA